MKWLAKILKDYPTLTDRFIQLPSGVGRELKNLRNAVDAVAYAGENGLAGKLYGSSEADIKVAGRTGDVLSFNGGWPAGYEKASAQFTYVVGPPAKKLIITAVKPGELGELIRIVFASAADDGVVVDGMTITISIDNDGATVPADLQAAVAANVRAAGMIAITSTDTTAIPNAFALAAPSGYLAGGTGMGLGYDIENNQTWGNTAAIAFVAKKPGLAAAKYEVKWVAGIALSVSATRKRCTITYQNGVTTVALAVAAVNANRIAAEHLTALAAGDGAGALTGLDTKVYTLGLDYGTMVQVGDVMGNITAIAVGTIAYNVGAQIAVVLATTANVRARLGLVDLGSMSFPTIA